MSEQSAWATLRGHLVGMDGRVHIQRLEDKLSTGIPDTNVCWQPEPWCDRGYEFWLEGKFIRELPKRATTKVMVGTGGLSAEQALWLETRQRAGGKVFVWIRVADHGWLLFHDRFRALQRGIVLSDFQNEPVYPNAKALVLALKVMVLSEPVK